LSAGEKHLSKSKASKKSKSPSKNSLAPNLFKLVHADQIEAQLTDWIREAFDFAS
jgi:hypothetical protein